ncbi:hypothetical protein CAPTEDRAFT_180983 [Capitella teleta]|uniref:FYVE, RhoGEF and PH domain-containing protein 6 n=1 Tax=Capitella teleta TaxID=283909 RepID=R7TRL5_CAPTE|nr:hypothetical protein CAPTEDRAFT_180983 [Capitella teleta]|eukprot:ELT96558.1 hypothetical protein CAPTEDRAFT_180983 [Capitella teleta]
MYTDYIREFESICKMFDEARQKYPEFDRAVNEFENSEKCSKLAVKHFMLKPIQRIPQYRLLLQDYKKHLTSESDDYKDTEIALTIVSEVADHANQSMKYGDNLIKLLEIQNSLIGQFEVIRPGRCLIKEGILNKLSRKEMQPRMFYLFNDVLLYTTPVGGGFRLNNTLPLTGMKVIRPTKEDFQNEFSIISTQRSFTISASTSDEKEEWLSVLEETIAENIRRRSSYTSTKQSIPAIIDIDNIDFKLGTKAPVWIPDARVSMCMTCTSEFTVTFRRHHCRACGKVVCGFCSDCKAPLRYLMYKPARVCQECFDKLSAEVDELSEDCADAISPTSETGPSITGSAFSKSHLKSRFKGIRMGSLGKGIFSKRRPAVLNEVSANVEDAEMSGYLKQWTKKRWKKMWFVLKGKVLYTYKASEDAAADDSKVLLGYEVRIFSSWFQGIEPSLVFEIIHSGTRSLILRTESPLSRDKWISALRNATIP